MNRYLEEFIKQAIIKQIKDEKNDRDFEYEFYFNGVQSLIYDYVGKAYVSCWNDVKNTYFDATVEWKKCKDKVCFKISYKSCNSKKELGIYQYL